MRKIKRKRKHKEIEETELAWLTKEIQKKISIRRNYNKQNRRNLGNEELDNLYIKQKSKVKALVRDATSQHERKVTDEIRDGGNKIKDLWNHIKRLKGETVNRNYNLYHSDGNIIKEEVMGTETEEFWSTIYRQN